MPFERILEEGAHTRAERLERLSVGGARSLPGEPAGMRVGEVRLNL